VTGDPELSGATALGGRTALVTGAGGGIGSEVVRVLAGAGARVVGVDLPGHVAGGDADTIACDVGDGPQVASMLAGWNDRFGGLDVVVHCAGITRDAVVWKMDEDAWRDVLRVNLDSAFHVVRGAVPLLRERGGGSIVLISSINGERGKFGQANYAASKAGLIGLARSVAREAGRFGVRVNVVAPGLIETAMTAKLDPDVVRRAVDETALGRAGRPRDVAMAVLYLVSGMAAHVTGQVLRVDGGQLTA
jgi:NAD(P)-dependent dehydrogenase (short-subunit alcohol dehydrogenase family)